jgi:tRNA(Ile)-lysidine synthase
MAPLQGRRAARDNLIEGLLRAVRADPVLGGSRASRVLVAFSGGPDSTALLHGLRRAADALHLTLAAAHVDHHLQAGSDEHAGVAAGFAAELGVAFEVLSVRPPGRGEDAARRARHTALEAAARRLGAASIAFGHTADDQAETVLLHLLRGSGVGGLAGMAPREGLRFRPLLEVTRQQVRAYCERHRLRPVHDASNDDLRFARNRVRHGLMPLLESDFNPRAKDALLRLARAARDEHAVVELAARAWLASQPPGGPMSRTALAALPRAVQVEVLRTAWSRAAGSQPLPGGAVRLEQALRLFGDKRPGMIHLGRGFELHTDANRVEIRPSGA